jgi:hypothetical protein
MELSCGVGELYSIPNIDTITGNEEYIYMRYYNGSDTSNSLVLEDPYGTL